MKIKYTHISDPGKEKIYDTVKSLENNPFIEMTQEEWDRHELEKMRLDRERGKICHFEIIEDEQEAEPNEQNHGS